jgi:hypothetical protein
MRTNVHGIVKTDRHATGARLNHAVVWNPDVALKSNAELSCRRPACGLSRHTPRRLRRGFEARRAERRASSLLRGHGDGRGRRRHSRMSFSPQSERAQQAAAGEADQAVEGRDVFGS